LVASSFGCSQDEPELVEGSPATTPGVETAETDPLSEEEREWLAVHPVIRLAPDPDFPPIEYFDENGEYRGLVADYVALVEQKLGIQFEIVQLENWDEVLEKGRSRQIDMFGAAMRSPQRSEYMLFTSSHIELPGIIVGRQEVKGSLTMEELQGMRVVVVSGYVWQDLITNDYPDLELDLVPDIQTGLRKISFGMADAMVGDSATTTYYIKKEGITNLRVAGESDYIYQLAFASRNDWPELNRILEKGLAQISEEEKQAIYKKWIRLEQESLLARKEVRTAISAGVGVIVLIIVSIMTWNRFLKRQVDQRTKELKSELAERKRADEELRKHREYLEELVAKLVIAKEQAETADQLKSAFMAAMSHELRTPLNSIMGFTGSVLQGLSGPLNDEQARQLGMAYTSARHLFDMIKDVLDIIEIESGQLKITRQPFDMCKAIEKVVRAATPLAEKKGLVLAAEVAPQVGQITSDRRRVEQIPINLVNNGVKFTEKGEVRVECQVNDSWLVTRVVDTGIGIKPEDVGKLFEAFQQVDTGLARRYEGTGLGLSICKRLVEILGGEIGVESEWGMGSTFTFTLPRRET